MAKDRRSHDQKRKAKLAERTRRQVSGETEAFTERALPSANPTRMPDG